MKVTMIHGQNHKGSTYHMGRMLSEKLAEESDITEFFMPKDLNHFCLGCYRCIEDEKLCPFYSEKKTIADAMEKADVLIFTTPTYCMAPSAAMKSFMDLFFTNWLPHRPKKCMFNKKAAVLSTTAGMGAKSAMKPVIRMLKYWGVPYCKSYGLSVQAASWHEVSEKKKKKIEKDMDKLAKRIKSQKAGTPSPFIKFMFMAMRASFSHYDDSSSEKEYWRQQGWFEKNRPWK